MRLALWESIWETSLAFGKKLPYESHRSSLRSSFNGDFVEKVAIYPSRNTDQGVKHVCESKGGKTYRRNESKYK